MNGFITFLKILLISLIVYLGGAHLLILFGAGKNLPQLQLIFLIIGCVSLFLSLFSVFKKKIFHIIGGVFAIVCCIFIILFGKYFLDMMAITNLKFWVAHGISVIAPISCILIYLLTNSINKKEKRVVFTKTETDSFKDSII